MRQASNARAAGVAFDSQPAWLHLDGCGDQGRLRRRAHARFFLPSSFSVKFSPFCSFHFDAGLIVQAIGPHDSI